MTPMQTTLDQTCRIQAPVANARAMFEMYEQLTERPYGIRISSDRKWIDVFMFDSDRFDIELSFDLEAPLPGLAPDGPTRNARLILSDGGPRFIADVMPGVPTESLTRAALLAGLDQAAAMKFFNMEIVPIVQRLEAR